ncbi:MAG TPA: hypothetical protein VE033_06005 [Acetobacteraceae bacterium]|jgi:hypothetical protein|nr:hypothetical protein [Acetobacteraceae bacterium]
MRRLLLLGLLLLAAPARAQQSGLYDVTGTNLDGTAYTGVVQIQQAGLASFRILWRIGADTIEGVGMASGRTISVAYGLRDRPGLGVYTLNPDGSLDGEWTIVGAPAMGRERLVPRRAAGQAEPSGPVQPPAR